MVFVLNRDASFLAFQNVICKLHKNTLPTIALITHFFTFITVHLNTFLHLLQFI